MFCILLDSWEGLGLLFGGGGEIKFMLSLLIFPARSALPFQHVYMLVTTLAAGQQRTGDDNWSHQSPNDPVATNRITISSLVAFHAFHSPVFQNNGVHVSQFAPNISTQFKLSPRYNMSYRSRRFTANFWLKRLAVRNHQFPSGQNTQSLNNQTW